MGGEVEFYYNDTLQHGIKHTAGFVPIVCVINFIFES